MPDDDAKNEEVKKEEPKTGIILSPEIPKYLDEWTKNPNSKIFVKLAEEYRKSGLHEEALRVVEKGLDLNPTYLSGNMVLAKIYFDMGEYDKSLTEALKVTSAQTDNLMAQNLLLELYIKQGDSVNAAKICDIISYLDPKNEGIIARKEAILSGDAFIPVPVTEPEPDEDAQEPVTDEAASHDDEHEEAAAAFTTNTVAELYIKQGYTEKGLSIYKELLSETPNDAKLIEKIAELEAGLGGGAAPAEEPVAEEYPEPEVEITVPDIEEPYETKNVPEYELELTDIEDVEKEGVKLETMTVTQTNVENVIPLEEPVRESSNKEQQIERLESWLGKIQSRGGR